MKRTPLQYAKILYELTRGADPKDLPGIIEEFVRFLEREQMISKADYIIEAFEKYVREAEGVHAVTVTSAHELSQEVLEAIKKSFDGKTEIESLIDPKVLGGIIMQTKDTIFDGSIQGQLKQFGQHLVH